MASIIKGRVKQACFNLYDSAPVGFTLLFLAGKAKKSKMNTIASYSGLLLTDLMESLIRVSSTAYSFVDLMLLKKFGRTF